MASSNSETIKEFLVGLGFDVDEHSLKKFDDGIAGATKQVEKLAATTVAMITAIEAFSVKMGDVFEKLYFAGKRTNSLIADMQGVALAAQNLGGTAEGAMSAIENLGSAMRFNPGANAMLASLGVPMEHLGHAAQVLKDLGPILRQMAPSRQLATASALGIDERTLVAILSGLDKISDRYDQIYKKFGVNAEQAGEVANRFMTKWRDVEAYFTVTSAKLLLAIEPMAEKLLGLFERVSDFLEEHPAIFAGIVAGLAALGAYLFPITAAFTLLGAAVVAVMDDFETFKEGGKSLLDWDAITNGIHEVITALTPLANAFKNLWEAVAPVLKPIAHLLFTILKIMLKLEGIGLGLMTQALTEAVNKIAEFIRYLSDTPAGRWLAKKMGVADDAANMVLSAASDAPNPNSVGNGTAESSRAYLSGGTNPIGIRQNNPGNLRQWPGAGSNGGYAQFASPADGISAMTANLLTYSKRGWDTIDSIAQHWAPSNDNNNVPAYEAALSKIMGVGANAKLNLHDPATLLKLEQGITQHENGFNPYSTELMSGAINSRLNGGVTIQQKTDIVVHASGGANDTARAVGDQQDQVNNTLVRNMQGAVR